MRTDVPKNTATYINVHFYLLSYFLYIFLTTFKLGHLQK